MDGREELSFTRVARSEAMVQLSQDFVVVFGVPGTFIFTT